MEMLLNFRGSSEDAAVAPCTDEEEEEETRDDDDDEDEEDDDFAVLGLDEEVEVERGGLRRAFFFFRGSWGRSSFPFLSESRRVADPAAVLDLESAEGFFLRPETEAVVNLPFRRREEGDGRGDGGERSLSWSLSASGVSEASEDRDSLPPRSFPSTSDFPAFAPADEAEDRFFFDGRFGSSR